MARTCLSCHRKTEKGQHRCRHHLAITNHLMHGFPRLTLRIEHVPHVRARAEHSKGTLLVINKLPAEVTTPCQSIDPAFYFEEMANMHHGSRRALVSGCLSCPVLEQCREIAIAHQEYGFQGGMTPAQRASVRTLRGQALTNLTGPQQQHPDFAHGYYVRSGT